MLRHRGPSQIQFWFIALAIGIAAGFAALFFRKGIEALQAWLYGTEDVQYLHSFASSLPWYLILIIPVIGGLATGLILHVFTKDGVARGVADVIEGAALRDGRVSTRAGLASALASFITLSTGGSTGREGPVVHIAAVISTKVCRWIKADGITSLLHRGLGMRVRLCQTELFERKLERVIDPVERIETGIGILKNRLHILAKIKRLRSTHRLNVLPFEQNLAFTGRIEPQHDRPHRRFA